MNKVRVYILTTEGPAQVQRLVQEDPDVRSVVCLNGTTEALPISPAYDAFVRTPTGVIERHYGHPVYRMDVSAPITEGRSWQLGALLAHALAAAGRLSGATESADTALLLTGEVDRDLNVLDVDHVPDKLRAAQALIDELQAEGLEILFGLPEGNAGQAGVRDGIRRLAVAQAGELLARLELPLPGAGAEPEARPGGLPWLAIIAFALLGFTLGVGMLINRSSDAGLADSGSAGPVPPPAEAATALKLFELRPPAGSNCAAVRFGVADPVRTQLQPQAPFRYRSHGLDKLCGVEIASTIGLGSLSARMLAGDEVAEQALVKLTTDETMATAWQVRFNKRLRKPVHYQLLLLPAEGSSVSIEHKIERQ